MNGKYCIYLSNVKRKQKNMRSKANHEGEVYA